MGFLAHFNLYMLRNSINVAIVAMVNQTEVMVGNETANSSYDQCPDREQSNSAQTAKVRIRVVMPRMCFYIIKKQGVCVCTPSLLTHVYACISSRCFG